MMQRQEELQSINEELRLAQEAVTVSRDRYRTLFDSSPVGYLTLSRPGIITEANLTLAQMLVKERSSLINLSFESFVLPKDRPVLKRHLAKVVKSGERQECEIELLKSDNTGFYVQLESIQLKNVEAGAGLCLTTVTDISERVQFQKDLHIREAEMSAMLDSAPMLMLLVDTERRVVKSNRAAAEFAGRRLEEMIGLRAGEALHCLHSLDDPRGCGSGPSCGMCLIRRTVIDTIETGNGHHQVEWKLPFERGGKSEEMTFFLYTSPVELPQKRTVVFIQDISEVKKSEERIKDLNATLTQHAAELEALNRELESFSYSVSHDLKAPLRSMDGFSQAVLEDYGDKLDAVGQDFLRNIRTSSQQMSSLIDDLLDLSRITRKEMHLEPVDLSGLATEVAAELKRIQPERRVDFVIEPHLTGTGDRALLKLVFDNLMGNAFKFTGKRAEAKIEFASDRVNGKTVFFVRDNGAGFDMEYADKLFKPFQRLHSAREFPGTGIGLASVQRIINRFGGKVWVKAELNKGATFYFSLAEY